MATPVEHFATPPDWTAPRPLPSRFETARTVIRTWTPADAQGMLAALDADRTSYLPWLPWVAIDNQDFAQCIYQIERFRRDALDPENDFTLGIFDRDTGEVIGGTGLHRLFRARGQAEIGYWVRPERRREGLCTEAVAGLISWAFTPAGSGGWGLRRIEILCAVSNIASQRVPQRLGLRAETHKRKAAWYEGRGWEDKLGWGVLAEEWDCVTARLRPAPA
jgi:RimJ/RimL family protein N-acetyltransferase